MKTADQVYKRRGIRSVRGGKGQVRHSGSSQNQERMKEQRQEVDSSSSRSLPWLPIEMVTEILSRLPPEPLLRFRSVCKSWRYIINSYHFVYNLHLPRSRAASRTHLLLRKENRFFYYDDESSLREICLPFSIDDGNGIYLTSSYNGLLCFSQCRFPGISDFHLFHVVNPATGKVIHLPPTRCADITLSTCQILWSPPERDGGQGIYKVLLVYQEGEGVVHSLVCTLGQDVAWRSVPNCFRVWRTSWGLKEYPSVNGAIHCVYSSRRKDLGGRVAAFHVLHERFREIFFPPGCCSAEKKCWNEEDAFFPYPTFSHLPRVVELRGLLALLHMNGPGTLLETWLLTDYSGGVWIKDRTICLQLVYKELRLDMKQRTRPFTCLAVHPVAKISERELVMEIVTNVPSLSSPCPSSTKLAVYHFSYDPLLKSTTLPSPVKINGGLYIDGLHELDGVYTKSLASPFETSNLISKKNKTTKKKRQKKKRQKKKRSRFLGFFRVRFQHVSLFRFLGVISSIATCLLFLIFFMWPSLSPIMAEERKI